MDEKWWVMAIAPLLFVKLRLTNKAKWVAIR